jgi:MIP family channel proteins
MAGHLRPLLAEMAGTAALTLFGSLSVAMTFLPGYGGAALVPALGHGLTLMAMVYAIGPVSGCHINPAITVALLVNKKIDGKTAALYILFQLAGAVVAGLILLGALEGTSLAADSHYGSTRPNSALGVNGLQTAGIEFVLTGLLAFVVFNVAVLGRAPSQVHGLVIGGTLAATIVAAGPLTGASLNPARTFGPALISAVAGLPNPFPFHWAYWVGPIAGAVVASLVVMKLLGPSKSETGT